MNMLNPNDFDVEIHVRSTFDDPAMRARYFGTSHTATMFDTHPFETAAEYWLDKRDGTSKPETSAMLRGTHLEPAVFSLWSATSDNVGQNQRGLPMTRGPLVAIPDYVLTAGNTVLSIKTTSKQGDEIQDYWWWQVQGEMVVGDYDQALIVWLDGRLELHEQHVARDHEAGIELFNRADEFMRSLESGNIETLTMPDWVKASHTASSIIRQYPSPAGSVDVDDSIRELVAEYKRLKTDGKEYEVAAKELRDQLFVIVGNNEAITFEDTPIATFKKAKGRSGFDLKAFAADHPDLAKEYTTIGEPTRALRIPKAAHKLLD